MLHRISQNIAWFFFDENDAYPLDIYIYGIELILSSLIGTVLVFGLGIVSGYAVESIIFMVSLSAVRIFSGGYHAYTYLKCNMIFVISAVLSLLCYQFYCLYLLDFHNLIMGILFLLSLILLLVFAPIENPNKKIDDSDRNKFKILSVIVLLSEMIFCMLMYGLFGFYQVLMILPAVLAEDIAILVEIILRKRRNNNDQESFEKGS